MLVHRDRSTYTMSGGFWPNLKNTIQKYSKVIIMVMMNDFQDSLSSDQSECVQRPPPPKPHKHKRRPPGTTLMTIKLFCPLLPT